MNYEVRNGLRVRAISKRAPWWRTKWARRLAMLCAGAALAASCALLPPVVQPACVALVKVIHAAGIP